MAHATISSNALISMVLSAIEVYKKETYGMILGRKAHGNYSILHATTFQSAQRDYDFVSIDLAREKRINSILRHLTNYNLLGDFHSHADGFEKLSRYDTKELLKMGYGWISVLLTIKKSRKKARWRYNARERSLSGPVGDYTAKIFAFVNSDGVIDKIPVRCSFVKAINRRLKTHKLLERRIEKLNKEAEKRLRLASKMQQRKIRI